MEGTKTRVVIADDHTIFRDGLQRLLELEEDFEVVGQAADGVEAVAMVLRHEPSILLLDFDMPRMSGLEVLRELAPQPIKSTRCILLTAAIPRRQIIEALESGAWGVVMKESATCVLLNAIRTVAAGSYWVEREPVTNIETYVRAQNLSRFPSSPRSNFGLTRRETEILGSIVVGLSNKEIAKRFSLSEDTVKHHLTSVFNKIGVSSRLELALFAINNRLIQS